jgi:hypothetical protein
MTQRLLRAGVLATAVLLALVLLAPPAPTIERHGGRRDDVSRKVYAVYYLWWSEQHWRDRLGSRYPVHREPLPLPARLGRGACNAVSRYPGNQLTDVPRRLHGQDDPGVIERHVRQAAAAGLRGFIVNWRGTGKANQRASSISYSRRLKEMFRAVHEVNRRGIRFELWLAYDASSTVLPIRAMINDLAYLRRTYRRDPALDRTLSRRPPLVWIGSRKYPVSTIRRVSDRFRRSFYLIGDENWETWNDGRAKYLNGDTYYWSSQNPYTNPASFDQLAALSRDVRAGFNRNGHRKQWFAPLAPGYNSELLDGGSCVPRRNGRTVRRLFKGNARSRPSAWTLISWNEIAEGTYVQPLQRWGDRYLRILSSLIRR